MGRRIDLVERVGGIGSVLVAAWLLALTAGGGTAEGRPNRARPLVVNGGFEAGPEVGWGHGQYSKDRPWWWNSRDCLSVAEISGDEHHGGKQALHIVNLSPRAPHVYGTTQQPIRIQPGKRYRVALWAKAPQVASRGAVSIVVDSSWRVHPISLPAGSYGWKRFSGQFTLNEDTAQLRILCEDMAEVWIDDVEVTPMD
jgi:hypothetical protein